MLIGLEKRIDVPTPAGPHFLTVAVAGQDFEIVLWPGTPAPGLSAQGIPPATVTIETTDCREAFDTLTVRGVTFESGVLEFPWGLVARFVDPDGNLLQIRQGRQPAAR